MNIPILQYFYIPMFIKSINFTQKIVFTHPPHIIYMVQISNTCINVFGPLCLFFFLIKINDRIFFYFLLASRVPVPDQRFDYLVEYFKPPRLVPTIII